MTIHKKNDELEMILNQIKSVMSEKIVLPVGVSYKIVKNKIAIEQALQAYWTLKDEIIARYSGGKVYINKNDDPENYAKVTAEVVQIAEEYTDVDIPEITVDELGEKDLPLNVMSALGFMMK